MQVNIDTHVKSDGINVCVIRGKFILLFEYENEMYACRHSAYGTNR